MSTLRARIEALVSDFQANGNSRELGDPRADVWQKAALHLLDALAQDEDPIAASGLESRYRVKKINDPTGKHADCRYFVLDPLHDLAARLALNVYAAQVGYEGNERLEIDLIDWLDDLGEIER